MPRLNAQALLALPYDQMVGVIRRWTKKNIAESESWKFWARNDQAEPLEDWRVWLVMAGRGYGKTRMGAEWVSGLAAQHPGARFALVGATLNEARAVMVEGESGLLSLPFCRAARLGTKPAPIVMDQWRSGHPVFRSGARKPARAAA